MNCLFCDIASGKIPSTKVYEDEYTYAFLDINPLSIGHSLVVPKKHYTNTHDTPEETFKHVMSVAKKVSTAVKKAVAADGVNVSINNGKAAGQIIFHLHAHIIPRFDEDGFGVWKRKGNLVEKEITAIAEKIRENIS